jgi:hypothetical protein
MPDFKKYMSVRFIQKFRLGEFIRGHPISLKFIIGWIVTPKDFWQDRIKFSGAKRECYWYREQEKNSLDYYLS